jgi:hypothetical protein
VEERKAPRSGFSRVRRFSLAAGDKTLKAAFICREAGRMFGGRAGAQTPGANRARGGYPARAQWKKVFCFFFTKKKDFLLTRRSRPA